MLQPEVPQDFARRKAALSAFRAACKAGDKTIAMLASEAAEITKEELLASALTETPKLDEELADLSDAFYVACWWGHAEVVRWLVAAFGLSREDVLNHGLRCFGSANVELAAWLVDRFGLTFAECVERHDPIGEACRTNSVGMIRLIDGKLRPGREFYISGALTSTLIYAVQQDAIAVAEWLQDRYSFSKGEALLGFSRYGSFDMSPKSFRWLARALGLSRAECAGLLQSNQTGRNRAAITSLVKQQRDSEPSRQFGGHADNNVA